MPWVVSSISEEATMSRKISMNVGHYALTLSLTAVLLMMEAPRALFESTW